MNKITVIGSLSTDFVVTTNTFPSQGETVFGETFKKSFGGKGSNQAVAMSRLGANVSMVGAVGLDSMGDEIISNLIKNNVDVTNVKRINNKESGSAHITIFDRDNRIIVVPGANYEVTKEQVISIKEEISSSDFVVLQHEIPQLTNEWIIEFCYDRQVPVLLNPAPARRLTEAMIDKVTYLTPNEHEFGIIFESEELDPILEKYANKLIVTLGTEGAVFNDGKSTVRVPAFKAFPIDTTGAGDTFNGAFVVGRLKGYSISDSLRFANLAASYSVQKFGAQDGMPTLDEIELTALNNIK